MDIISLFKTHGSELAGGAGDTPAISVLRRTTQEDSKFNASPGHKVSLRTAWNLPKLK